MELNQESEVKKNLHTSLKELGLVESEANLYLISLALGPSNITTLAKHLGIPRPNVYKAIAGLEVRGLANFAHKKQHARTFVVEPPTTVLELLRKKREKMAGLDLELAGAMPDLLARYHQGETPTKIKVFSGREQFLDVFFQVLDEAKDDIKYFGSADTFITFVGWKTENQWIKKRKEQGLHIDCLLLSGEDARTLQETDAEEARTTKVLHDIAPFATSFMLYTNKVIIFQPKAPLLVLMEDEYIVEMLRGIFNVLWSDSKTG